MVHNKHGALHVVDTELETRILIGAVVCFKRNIYCVPSARQAGH
jgi:hypothetical protein